MFVDLTPEGFGWSSEPETLAGGVIVDRDDGVEGVLGGIAELGLAREVAA
jgi:hypothetical protein